MLTMREIVVIVMLISINIIANQRPRSGNLLRCQLRTTRLDLHPVYPRFVRPALRMKWGCLSRTVQSEGGLAFIIRGRKLGRTLLLLLVDLFLLLRELFIQLLGALLLSPAATAKETTSRHDDGLSKAVQIIKI
jgi:hypothetical protein